MVTNLDRANWADKAMLAFREETGCEHADSLGDLLCDLMHWADASNFDFDFALVRAGQHYEAECEESGDENPSDCKPTVRSKKPTMTMSIAETAIYANLSALAEQLAEAAKLSTQAAAASKLGKRNQAIGTALPLEDLLKQASGLYDAAIALHRHTSRG